MSFTATITINCWKEHRCVGCGGAYRYKFARKAQGTGNTESDAGAAAEKQAIQKMQGEVDERPCPHCGCLQPDMIGQEKANSHLGFMGFAAAAALALLIMAIIPSATWMPYSLAAYILGGISAVVLVAHWAVALGNPNSNKARNREKAEKLVDAGEMEAVRKPSEDRAEGDPRAVVAGAMVWLLAATVGLLLILAPVILKAVNGWSSNDGLKPDVVGPGDTVRVYFDTSIDCVSKLWSGSPQATATAGGKSITLSATASNDTWGMQMSVKNSQKNTRPTLWADVTIPKDDALAGQTLALTVKMDVRYPTMQGGNNFGDGRTQATLTRDLRLSAVSAGASYRLTFWAMVGGAVLMAVAGVILSTSAGALKQQAPDTRVVPVRDTDGETADYRRRDAEDDEDAPPPRRPSRDEDEAGEWKK